MDYSDILGKLPERIENHVKEDTARVKFREMFTDPYFIVRDELENDYGVDICIEAIVNNGKSPTNIRAHVQLKSSEKNENSKGDYSYSVAVSNLNYLINNPNSCYMFFSVKESVFYFTFADEVYAYYESLGSDWKEQDTITIHFSNLLDKEAINEIHSKLLKETLFFKNVRLNMRKNGIEPGANFVYGGLVFESPSDDLLQYQGCTYAYTTDKEGKVIFMHNLIWEAEHGTIPKGYQVYHVNGNTLDNRRRNLDIMKTFDAFDIEGFQKEVEEAQAYNILKYITEGNDSDFKDAPPPPKALFDKIIDELKQKGWRITAKKLKELKRDLGIEM